ncbi:MAG: sulfurtransferase [Xanthomonadales bacterium]|nr:sulfurtransferase [Xanthomonadales bacterium]
MNNNANTIEPEEVHQQDSAVIFDCRFSLADYEEGKALYQDGHIPDAYYLSLETDMSSQVSSHGGRHPLPDPNEFVALLAAFGVGLETDVIAYDDSRFAYASRLWWMMKSLGFKPPKLLNGGYQAWLATGGKPEAEIPVSIPIIKPEKSFSFSGYCDIEAVRAAQKTATAIVDSREAPRYLGIEEPIDPIAGSIPTAVNRPWQGVSDDSGRILDQEVQRQHWGELLDAGPIIVYCGSGVTACVNLFSLASLGQDDAILYVGSWSDWCSYS